MTQQTKYSIIAVIIVALLLVVSFFVLRTKRLVSEQKVDSVLAERLVEKASSEASSLRDQLLKIKASDVVIGNDNAPVTIFEYASYSCSHCAHFSKAVYPELKQLYIDTGVVRFVLRDFPLDEPSLRAAQLTRCVDKSSYEALSKTLFEQRLNWAYGKDYPEKLENIAKILGISGDAFHKCMENKSVEEVVLNYRYEVSKAYNVSSTPTLIINGQKYNGNNNISALREYIEKIK